MGKTPNPQLPRNPDGSVGYVNTNRDDPSFGQPIYQDQYGGLSYTPKNSDGTMGGQVLMSRWDGIPGFLSATAPNKETAPLTGNTGAQEVAIQGGMAQGTLNYPQSSTPQTTSTGSTTSGTTTPVNNTPLFQVPSSTSTSTPITSTSLTPPAPINYQSAAPPPAYPVATLGSAPGIDANGQMSLTPEEQKAQDYTTKLQDLNNQLIGQSSYRAEQENAAGLGALKQTQTDLTSQLNALKNEAMAIPLQAQNQSDGRGITAGGLRPIEAAAARNNAIQALSINSLLEATNGNISTALQMVDRAVAQKFDPIKEQIDVAQRNLELILNSPQASIEDKNRAVAQQAIQQAKADTLAQEQENWKNVQKIAVDAAAGGADALTLNKIQNAKSPTEAAQIAAAAGIYKSPEQDAVQSIAMDAAQKGASAEVIAQIQATKDPVQAVQIAAQAGIYNEQEKADKQTIQQIAMEAAAAGASTDVLNQIYTANNPITATQIAQRAGIYTQAAAGTDGFTLSPGQTRYDAQGNPIAQADKPVEPGSAYQEISPGATVYDPATGQAVYTAPYTPSQSGAEDPNKQIGSVEAKRLTDAGYKNIYPTMTQAEMTAAVNSQIKPAAPGGYPTGNLQPGSTDKASVTKLQNWLVQNGYMTQADMNTGPGIYGPKTTAAVAKVQAQYGVDNTGAVGYWGPKTQAALAGGAPTPPAKTTSSGSSSGSSSSSGTKVTWTPTQQNSLIGTGIPQSDLSSLQSAVNQNGLQAVLDDGRINGKPLTAAQKAALQKIYGIDTSTGSSGGTADPDILFGPGT